MKRFCNYFVEDLVTDIIKEIGEKYFPNFSLDTVVDTFRSLLKLKPELEGLIHRARNPQDVERIFNEISGIIEVNAKTGSIDIENAILTAIRSATFNHSDGTVTINESTITAPILTIGGFDRATGTTEIKAPDLRAKGSAIKGSKNTGIKIKGNAGIRMS